MAAKKNGWWIAVVIILAIGLLWYWYMKMYPVQSSVTPQATPTVAVVAGQVIIESNTFIPSTMTVKVGDTVTWVNNETYNHWVLSNDGLFDSGSMAPGGQYKYTFTKVGTYQYICKIHPFMTGIVIVTK